MSWEDGVPPEVRAAWQADTARGGTAAWDDWSREAAESRPAAVPITIGTLVLAAVIAAVTTVPTGTVVGSPVAAVTVEPPARKLVTRATPKAVPPATSAPVQPPAPTTAPPPQAQSANTVRLAGGGTATLVRKDVVDGVLPVPEGVREATWWGAAFDASTGATVLAGHVNWKGSTGPFAELWDAKVGDLVTVVDAAGVTYTYRVSRFVTVHKDELPSRAQELFGQEGDHRLVLVTCGGRWVGGRDGYEENRVVIADPA
jgi:LPXTG-site transpeptidase (sortase) family protein